MIISELERLVEEKYLDEEDPNLWRAIPYRTEEFAGVMLGYGEGTAPVPVTIKLGMQGLYRVHLGIYSFVRSSRIRVRLSEDLCCQMISPPQQEDRISFPVL